MRKADLAVYFARMSVRSRVAATRVHAVAVLRFELHVCDEATIVKELLDKARNGPPVGANETDVNILVKQAAL